MSEEVKSKRGCDHVKNGHIPLILPLLHFVALSHFWFDVDLRKANIEHLNICVCMFVIVNYHGNRYDERVNN